MSLEVSSLRAVAHPVRLRILSLLTGVDMSAAEIARELGITQANASYHLRVLADDGRVVEAGTEKIRGGVAKRYTHPWRDTGTTGGAANEAEFAAFIHAIADELVRRASSRTGRASLVTDAEMWVPSDIWSRAKDLVQEASALVHDSARRPRAKGAVHVNLTAALFEMDTRMDTR